VEYGFIDDDGLRYRDTLLFGLYRVFFAFAFQVYGFRGGRCHLTIKTIIPDDIANVISRRVEWGRAEGCCIDIEIEARRRERGHVEVAGHVKEIRVVIHR